MDLRAPRINILSLLFLLLGLAFLELLGLLYWYKLLLGGLSPIWAATGTKLGAAGCVALPLLIGAALLKQWCNPARLLIDDRGVTLSDGGTTRHLSWDDISSVRTKIIANNSSALPTPRNPRTLTILSGGTSRLSWFPVFGIAPEALAAYITQRQNQSSRGPKASYSPPQEGAVQRHFVKAERGLHRLGNVVGILLLAASLLFICAAGVYAWWLGMI